MNKRRKVLRIDPEVRMVAKQYLDTQIAIMRTHGSMRELTEDQYEDILYKCAEPVQVVKNWKARETEKSNG